MDTAALEELRALRARAYGPDADIAEDPSAVRRLRELEAQSAGSTTVSPVAAATDVTSTLPAEPEPQLQRAAPPAARADAPVETSGELGAPTEPAAPTPDREVVAVDRTPGAAPQQSAMASGADARAGRTRRISQRLGLMWGLSVVAAAALAAGITYAATSITPVPVSSGAPQIATLEPDPLLEIPSGWFGAGPSSRVWEFYGLTLFETTQMFNPGGSSGSDCFLILPTDQLPEEGEDVNNWSTNGSMWSACGLGAFPATAEVPVGSSTPEALRDQFPPGSTLQFVLVDDRIGVYIDSP